MEQAHSLTLDQLKEVCRNATPSCVLLEGLSLEGVDKTELCPNAGLYIREVKPFHILSFSDCALLQLFHTGMNIVFKYISFHQVGKRVAECGGAALIVDYGEELGSSAKEDAENAEENVGNTNDKKEESQPVKRIERDTLRAFRHHKQVHPLVRV